MPRVRPHFKCHTTIAHHRKMGNVYRSNDLVALWLRLGVVAIDRYAARDGDCFRVHRSEVGELAGGKRRDKAEALLRELSTELGLGANLVGSYWELEWPKFAQKQGFSAKNGERIETPDTEALRAPPLEGGSPKSTPPEPTTPQPPASTPPPPGPVAALNGHRAKVGEVTEADRVRIAAYLEEHERRAQP